MTRTWPRGTCPRCGRLISGRLRDDVRKAWLVFTSSVMIPDRDEMRQVTAWIQGAEHMGALPK